jgi:CRISPR/Cas system-associated exonuclease Cas4 (RecB family)
MECGVKRNEGEPDSWGARERGNLIERHLLVPAMRAKFNHLAMYMGEEQRTFHDGYLSATPDCLLHMNGHYVLVEFKTIDPRAQLVEAKPEHVYQTQVQMGVLNHTGQKVDKAIISYTDASFLSETKEFEITFDPDYYTAAKKRADKIMLGEKMTDFDPEGWIAGGRECQYCPFSVACGVQRKDVPANDKGIADPQFVAEISDLARQYKLAQHLVEKSETDVRQLQTDIKSRLQEKQIRRVVGNGVSVSWTQVKGRETTDVKGLREAAENAGIDLDQYTSVADPSDRLTVTVKEQ